MSVKKTKITSGFSTLDQDKRLTLPDRGVALRGDEFELSPEELEVKLFERILAQDPVHEEALRNLGHIYTAGGQYQKGLEMDRRLVKLCPDDPVVFYNLACSLSLLEQLDEACDALRKAIELGFHPLNQIEKDPDLSNLRLSPLFRQIANAIAERRSSR
jgi:tetratricopeptide (TPR) repeat protein